MSERLAGDIVKRYRKKPVVIDAMQTDGTLATARAIEAWANDRVYASSYNTITETCDTISITTLEGTMRADVGDWIIKGVAGEFYPCKPDIFEQTYEQVV